MDDKIKRIIKEALNEHKSEKRHRRRHRRDRHNHRSRERRSSASTRRSRSRSRSPVRSRSCSTTRSSPASPAPTTTQSNDEEEEKKDKVIDLTTALTEEVDENILALLGDAPKQDNNGPNLLPSVVTRWEYILKKGLEKDQRNELIKKYPPPGNFMMLSAPKLNPEAQAAAGDSVLKRDKAMETKQRQVACAITALGMSLNILCKSDKNQEAIQLISDAARLLCDHQNNESITRKNFILYGLDKSIREGIKENETDQWLFGSGLAEKLRACKAIQKTGQELTNKRPLQTNSKNNLNFKGKTNNTFKPKQNNQKAMATSFTSKKKDPRPHQSQSQQSRSQNRNHQHQRNSGRQR